MQLPSQPLDGERKMSEYWLTVDYVGFNRAFLVGATPDNPMFERELTPEERQAVTDFTNKQRSALEEFLFELAAKN